MRRILISAMCGILFVGLLAAWIALPKRGTGFTTVLQAQTENESQATVQRNYQSRRGLTCTASNIRGRFAVRAEGALALPTGTVPFTSLAVMTFDGYGGLTNAATTSTNGTIVSGVTTGSYSINSDCTGQMTVPSVSNPAAPPLTFNFIIADSGNEISLIATRAPAVLSGNGERMD